jgi:chromosome segregation ATPase
MSEHEEAAERMEREVEDMERRAGQVDEDIAETREEWERKQRDDAVPGAVGEPREELPPPEPDETD